MFSTRGPASGERSSGHAEDDDPGGGAGIEAKRNPEMLVEGEERAARLGRLRNDLVVRHRHGRYQIGGLDVVAKAFQCLEYRQTEAPIE
jgi:hypothetical protein